MELSEYMVTVLIAVTHVLRAKLANGTDKARALVKVWWLVHWINSFSAFLKPVRLRRLRVLLRKTSTATTTISVKIGRSKSASHKSLYSPLDRWNFGSRVKP